MKTFNSIEDMKIWFTNRSMDDDISYIKSISQQVLISSNAARAFNIYDGEFLDTSLILSEIDDVVKVDNEIIASNLNGFVYELWSLDVPQMLYWNKRLLKVGEQIYLLQELHPLADSNVRSIVGSLMVKRKWSLKDVKENFTQKERAIMYLSIHGMSTKQVAEVLFVSPGTIKGHIWDKIRHKMCNLGYEAHSKELVVETANLLGMGDSMPPILISRISPTTKLIKSYTNCVVDFNQSNEFDLRV